MVCTSALQETRSNPLWLGEKPEPLKSPANEIAEVLEGSRILQVRRVGKHIVFDLERSGRKKRNAIQHGQWIVHLGMTGRMQVTTPEAELARHTHAVVRLASGREVRFVDPRRFGRLGGCSHGSATIREGDLPLQETSL